MLNVRIKLLHPSAKTPTKADAGAAAFDLYAGDPEINGGTRQFVEYDTCVAMEIPQGYVGLVFPRSSISQTGMSLANSVGVIDSSYRGSIKLRFYGGQWASAYYQIGDRIGQIMIIPIPEVTFNVVQELSETDRGQGGFGSSGR